MSRRARRPDDAIAAVAIAGVLLLAITVFAPGKSLLGIAAPAIMVLVCLYFVVSPRIEVSLAVLLLYLGLLDGYLKLRSGSTAVTLGRDALLYSIVIGLLVRAALRHERHSVPPLAGYVLAFVLATLVQLFNPSDPKLSIAVAGVRPHLEWVPLFVLGFLVLRDTRRLRGFFVLLLIVAGVNGVVGLIQFALTPQQLARWGPGYSQRYLGTGSFAGAARTFADTSGVIHVRPLALGSDFGFGGDLGLIALPGALALIGFTRSRKLRVLALVGIAGVGLAVLTAQSRAAVVAAVGALIAYGMLSARSRQRGIAIVSLAAGLAVFYVLLTAFVSSNQSGAFDRYKSIAPSQIVNSLSESRGNALAVVPKYFVQIPFGAGLGSTGPAAVLASGGASPYNAETEFSYLTVEVGVAGMLAILALTIRMIFASFRIISRVADRETRAMIAALAAPLFSILGLWFVSSVSATTPLAPYFWLTAGGLSYWLAETAGAPSPVWNRAGGRRREPAVSIGRPIGIR